MVGNLSEESSREFLKEQTTGRLGCVLESGEPYVVPVNYLYEDKGIYIHSLPGQKISAMEANPKVCLLIDEMADDGFEWKSVIAFGEFEKIENKQKKIEILTHFYNNFPRFTPVEARFEDDDLDSDIVVFRIKIGRLTGVTESY
jgi:nitroimidazol reductase NimA-like FMN-containing flavoprotein (pyridoxamine 5'-phosphate oxidase superfamily)